MVSEYVKFESKYLLHSLVRAYCNCVVTKSFGPLATGQILDWMAVDYEHGRCYYSTGGGVPPVEMFNISIIKR